MAFSGDRLASDCGQTNDDWHTFDKWSDARLRRKADIVEMPSIVLAKILPRPCLILNAKAPPASFMVRTLIVHCRYHTIAVTAATTLATGKLARHIIRPLQYFMRPPVWYPSPILPSSSVLSLSSVAALARRCSSSSVDFMTNLVNGATATLRTAAVT